MTIGISVSNVGQPRTVRDLLLRSYQIAKILGKGEALDTPKAAEAFYILTELIELANTDKLFTVYETPVTIPLTSNKSVYTIGPYSASPVPDVVTVRPVDIMFGVSTRLGIDYPVYTTHSREDYERIILKSLSMSGWPSVAYYQASHPSGSVTVYPVPSDDLTALRLTVAAQVVPFTALEEEVNLPPMYFSWLQHKVAERLSPEYGQTWSVDNKKILGEVEDVLKTNNIKPFPEMGTGLTGLATSSHGSYNIHSDRGR